MTPDRLTIPEKLLVAALEVRKRSATFTAEDLIVEAWHLYPDTFGLSGYADKYPDSNRVLTSIMGTKGMRGKGWLRKVGEKQYRLTSTRLSDGEALFRSVSESTEQSSSYLRAELDRQTAAAFDRLISTLWPLRKVNRNGSCAWAGRSPSLSISSEEQKSRCTATLRRYWRRCCASGSRT